MRPPQRFPRPPAQNVARNRLSFGDLEVQSAEVDAITAEVDAALETLHPTR